MQVMELSQETLQALHEKRLKCFAVSEKAILGNPEAYREIRQLLVRIVTETVDIDDYFRLACRLADLLKTMGENTIFSLYFHDSINPCRNGQAWYFRTECRSLLEQIEELNCWRRERRKLRLMA
ncbi:MAG: hypothetical protein V1793_24090 [Pseudomonadota bacterium]